MESPSWEEQQAARRANAEKVNANFRALAEAVAKALGPDWKFREPIIDSTEYLTEWNSVRIEYPPKCSQAPIHAECTIYISRKQAGSRRYFDIGVGGVWDAKNNWIRVGDFNIKVDQGKSAEQIARDIKRRIFDAGFMVAFDHAVSTARAANDFEARRETLTLEFAALVAADLSHRNANDRKPHFTKYHDSRYLVCDVGSPESVKLEITLGVDEARKVLETVAPFFVPSKK